MTADAPRHEDSAAYWRANATEEKRKKQHVSGLLANALHDLEALRSEIRLLLLQSGAAVDLQDPAMQVAFPLVSALVPADPTIPPSVSMPTPEGP